jgi:2-aminoethylphosphonate dioxygenase
MPATAASLHALTDRQLATWEHDGFVSCPGRFTVEEVATWRTECDRLAADHERIHEDNLRYEITSPKDSGERKMWKIDPLVDISPVFRALTRDERILEPLRQIYRGSEPALFKDKLIYKPPGTHGNPLHQDGNWWQPFPKSCLTVTIAIDSGTRENGCTEIFSGHTRGFLHTPGRLDGKIDDKVDMSTVKYFESQPGDFGIFHCFAPHRAGVNNSQGNRRQLFLSYNDSADGELYLAHYSHFWNYRKAKSSMDDEKRARSYFR